MPSYRIYLIDTVGSRVSREDYDCADDAAATTLGTALLGKEVMVEIWQGTRCVGSVSAPSLPGLNGTAAIS
jgi:endonuclease YncB( thermonuclease family)